MRDLGIGDNHTVFRFEDGPRPHFDNVLCHRVDQQDAPVLIRERVQLLAEQMPANECVDTLGHLGPVYLDIGKLAGVGESLRAVCRVRQGHGFRDPARDPGQIVIIARRGHHAAMHAIVAKARFRLHVFGMEFFALADLPLELLE